MNHQIFTCPSWKAGGTTVFGSGSLGYHVKWYAATVLGKWPWDRDHIVNWSQ